MEMEARIKEELNKIEAAEDVRIIWSAESGSRAWGFASPDSDYDVRFIYVRNRKDYLRLNPVRDVIEWQLDEVLIFPAGISGKPCNYCISPILRSLNGTIHPLFTEKPKKHSGLRICFRSISP